MTRDTTTNHFGVIHHRDWNPHRGAMTGLADIRGVDMGGGFARRVNAVVTADATTGDRTVIYRRTEPTAGGVTRIASLRGRNMGHAFTDGNRAIMTTFTDTIHLRVIHDRYRRPTHTGVTRLAHIARVDVGCPFACRCAAIMTGNTGGSGSAVIEYHAQPGSGHMARVTRSCGRNMRG